MKIKSIAEQLKELGFKDGDRIMVKGYEGFSPYKIVFDDEDNEVNYLENIMGYGFDFEYLIGEEFEPHTPARTKEEILEWMKSLSKPFEYGEDNWVITYNYIYKAIKSYVSQFIKDIEPLYFTKENAEKIIDELTKEEVRILFDLEPEKDPKDITNNKSYEFKVGDIAEITIDQTEYNKTDRDFEFSYHEFKLGTKVKVTSEPDKFGDYNCEGLDEHVFWWVNPKEMKLVKTAKGNDHDT